MFSIMTLNFADHSSDSNGGVLDLRLDHVDEVVVLPWMLASL
jgi:hypothetical protein